MLRWANWISDTNGFDVKARNRRCVARLTLMCDDVMKGCEDNCIHSVNALRRDAKRIGGNKRLNL